jgi:hypothetical protein
MENREIGVILSTFEKFGTMNFSKVDKMAPISPFFYFPVANFSAQRSSARVLLTVSWPGGARGGARGGVI